MQVQLVLRPNEARDLRGVRHVGERSKEEVNLGDLHCRHCKAIHQQYMLYFSCVRIAALCLARRTRPFGFALRPCQLRHDEMRKRLMQRLFWTKRKISAKISARFRIQRPLGSPAASIAKITVVPTARPMYSSFRSCIRRIRVR